MAKNKKVIFEELSLEERAAYLKNEQKYNKGDKVYSKVGLLAAVFAILVSVVAAVVLPFSIIVISGLISSVGFSIFSGVSLIDEVKEGKEINEKIEENDKALDKELANEMAPKASKTVETQRTATVSREAVNNLEQ